MLGLKQLAAHLLNLSQILLGLAFSLQTPYSLLFKMAQGGEPFSQHLQTLKTSFKLRTARTPLLLQLVQSLFRLLETLTRMGHLVFQALEIIFYFVMLLELLLQILDRIDRRQQIVGHALQGAKRAQKLAQLADTLFQHGQFLALTPLKIHNLLFQFRNLLPSLGNAIIGGNNLHQCTISLPELLDPATIILQLATTSFATSQF